MPEVKFKKKVYNQSTDSVNGVVVFDNTTGKIYVGGSCFSSDVKDASLNTSTNVLTITKCDNTTITLNLNEYERTKNKTTSVSPTSTHTQYPSAKCIYQLSQDKPQVLWQAQSVAGGILAAQSDISQSPTWQITNLDMSPYQKVKLFIRSGGSGSDMTASAIIKIDLSTLNESPFGHYLGSAIVQNPNNANRFMAVSAAISEDKTSVLFSRCDSLYGTAATSINSDGRVLYKIVGYKGSLGHSFQIVGPDTFTGKNFNLQSKYDGVPVNSQWTIVSGGQYATVNQWGRVDVESGTVGETIVIQAVCGVYSEQKTIEITYDNQLVISCPDTITGETGSCVALYNNQACSPTWTITSGGANATINANGEITILQSGVITIQAVYSGYTVTKTVTLEYLAGTTQETVVNSDGSVTETTTTTTTDPQTGATTTESTSTTTNEDGSTSYTVEETTESLDGSTTTQSTTTNSDGTSSESTTNTSSPDPETGSVTTNTNTTNYDENGDASGSSASTTTENTDGSSSSSTTNYDADGDPTSGSNNTVDTSGNSHTQDLTYDDEGNSSVSGYTVDTSNNPEGAEDMTGTGVNTEYVPFHAPNGFVMHIKFRTVASEQPNPPIVPDTEDSTLLYNIMSAKSTTKINNVWPGFDIRWGGSGSGRKLQFRRTLVGETSSASADITSRHINNVYELTLTYNPNLSTNKFSVYDHVRNNYVVQVNKLLPNDLDLDLTLGYALNMQGQPYRYANVSILDFSVSNL